MISPERREEWSAELRAARQKSPEEGGFLRFRKVAEAAIGGGVFEAKCLASTITNDPEDNGEAEAVLSLLSSFSPEIQTKALVEELPRLEEEGASDFADSLIATESKFRPQQLIRAWLEIGEPESSALDVVLRRLSSEAIKDGEQDLAGNILRAIEGQR